MLSFGRTTRCRTWNCVFYVEHSSRPTTVNLARLDNDDTVSIVLDLLLKRGEHMTNEEQRIDGRRAFC